MKVRKVNVLHLPLYILLKIFFSLFQITFISLTSKSQVSASNNTNNNTHYRQSLTKPSISRQLLTDNQHTHTHTHVALSSRTNNDVLRALGRTCSVLIQSACTIIFQKVENLFACRLIHSHGRRHCLVFVEFLVLCRGVHFVLFVHVSACFWKRFIVSPTEF